MICDSDTIRTKLNKRVEIMSVDIRAINPLFFDIGFAIFRSETDRRMVL